MGQHDLHNHGNAAAENVFRRRTSEPLLLLNEDDVHFCCLCNELRVSGLLNLPQVLGKQESEAFRPADWRLSRARGKIRLGEEAIVFNFISCWMTI